ncbi:unnamed protein product [Mesocestoides corti]|uniref:RFXA_RFXANK_bdg domain-containing protein n=1 Tax=Mesocestoides corti TaxID=53468 RepID=A0A0R3UQE8_MESCO|nr:unnamed protein product [Mesocestoides corti]
MQPTAHYNNYATKGFSTYNDAAAKQTYQDYARSTSAYPSANPFFAAVAAAAAAGYSQQFSSGASNPLNLSNMIGSGTTDAASYASRCQAVYQAAYQNQYYSDYHQQHASTANQQRHLSAFHPASGCANQPQQPSQYHQLSVATQNPTSPSRQLTAQSSGAVPLRKSKKRPPSEMLKSAASDAKKKEDFEKLVKARTDKLLSDGPLFAPLTVADGNGTAAGGGNASSTSSCSSMPNSADSVPAAVVIASANARLLRTIVNEKTRLLLQSPAVRETLRSRQLLLENYKRRTELFAVQMNSTRN